MFVSALKLQKWLCTRSVLFMSWQIWHRKHWSDCPHLHLRCQSLFFTNQKSTSYLWFKSHAFNDTQWKKNPQRRKALWKLKGKKKGAATTVGDKAKQYLQSRWIIYNNICEAVHTWKKPKNHLASKRVVGDLSKAK